ncbi:MAG: NADH-quinone oxidoreductase subunit K [Solitalea-like symbiont of Acarus siro]
MIYKLLTLSYLSIFLISVGLYMVQWKRKIIMIIVGLEIITNGVAINLVLMSLNDKLYTGGIMALFLVILSTINIAFIVTFFIILFRANSSINEPKR